jgi:hypothetical protein
LNNFHGVDNGEVEAAIMPGAANFLGGSGWIPPVCIDGYIYSRDAGVHAMVGEIPLGPGNEVVGDMRIRYTFVPCGPVTVLAQQMDSPSKHVQPFTFRQWNPENTHSMMGEDNGSSTDTCCPTACICCYCVELCFKTVFQEVVNEIHTGHMSARTIFNRMIANNQASTTCFRYLAWFMNVLGHYLLFSPIIALLNWIPLVGWLLAGAVKFAAAIFSVVWGSLLHFVVLGVAWIVYRPLYGLLLLSMAGVCFGIMFYQKY